MNYCDCGDYCEWCASASELFGEDVVKTASERFAADFEEIKAAIATPFFKVSK